MTIVFRRYSKAEGLVTGGWGGWGHKSFGKIIYSVVKFQQFWYLVQCIWKQMHVRPQGMNKLSSFQKPWEHLWSATLEEVSLY